ncbi:hypothetical protein Smp_128810 [Schistosoma mansoni]|uniref:hypothetical protein n=1 Tax=Schistosoma mansoni TaxID=6183 RepID=UPI00022DC0BD|nr:hypothetical protein Smp_128810 [Schistosoma mansoni]|eukprot:XP_018650099.1 hypothetical protein Smp_128810 [Schistosoma mansoni]
MNCSTRNVNEPYDDIIVIDSDVDNKSYIHSSDGSDEEEGFDSNIASTELKQDKLDYPVETCNDSQGRIRQREVKEKKVDDSFSLKTCPAEMKQRKYNDSTKACDNFEEQSCHETVENKDTDTSKLDSDGNIHQFKYSISGYHTPSTNMYTNYNYYHLCLILALILRLVLVIFSVWQDTVRWPDGQLRFTDVDYDVFSDAAQAFVAGKNLYIERPTYRYSPLIAVLLAPGYWLFSDGKYSVTDRKEVNISSEFVDVSVEPHFRSSKHITVPSLARLWGKLIFITADLICGCIQYKIIQNKQFVSCFILFCFSWLFNPVTSVVSARGNADGLQSCFVLACLWCILNRRIIPAGFLYGLCIHVRIFPIIYAPSIYLWLMMTDNSHNKDNQKKNKGSTPQSQSVFSILFKLPNRNHFLFGISCLLSLTMLTGLCYLYFGGMLFLQQAYFYHFTRSDFKHNFAPHFLSVYLLSGEKWIAEKQILPIYNLRQCLSTPEVLERLFNVTSIMPCIILIPCLSFKLYSNISLCWFALTYTFVTFNRVCTAQYFLWSICLLPVALADIRLPSSITPYRAIVQNLMLWFGSQGIWLASAYALEMCTLKGPFLNHIIWIIVWTASLNFFACNIFILFRLISWRNRSLSDHYQEVSSSKVINYKTVVSPIIDSTIAVATNTNTTYRKYRISNKKTL